MSDWRGVKNARAHEIQYLPDTINYSEKMRSHLLSEWGKQEEGANIYNAEKP